MQAANCYDCKYREGVFCDRPDGERCNNRISMDETLTIGFDYDSDDIPMLMVAHKLNEGMIIDNVFTDKKAVLLYKLLKGGVEWQDLAKLVQDIK